jgi:hypothetical protein
MVMDPPEPLYVAKGEGSHPERAAQEAARRASGALRRYAMHNGLRRLWTLTYAQEPATWHEAWQDLEEFRRRWRRRFGREPMVAVPEHGEENGRKHFHCALCRYVDDVLLAEMWGKGYVSARLIRARKMAGPAWGPCQQSMVCASYISAYVNKNFESDHVFEKKRYSTSRGFTPVPERDYFRSIDAARKAVAEMARAPLYHEWSSSEMTDWVGPPVRLEWWESASA